MAPTKPKRVLLSNSSENREKVWSRFSPLIDWTYRYTITTNLIIIIDIIELTKLGLIAGLDSWLRRLTSQCSRSRRKLRVSPCIGFSVKKYIKFNVKLIFSWREKRRFYHWNYVFLLSNAIFSSNQRSKIKIDYTVGKLRFWRSF